MGDQKYGWRSWWEAQVSLVTAIDMSLETIGLPVLVNRVSLDLQRIQCSLHKIKSEPICLG